MQLTEELIKELGFNRIEDPSGNSIWVDAHGLTIYPHQMPKRPYELVRIMTGTAFKKGYRKAQKKTGGSSYFNE